ncbi:MAG: hypothetical protein U1E65_22160 [Myxococcota bacterium]
MLRRAFTTGSCWGWQGTMPPRASVRALDVTLEGDGPELITVVLEPIRGSSELSRPPNETEIEALLEWGSVQGAPHRAELDVGRGVTLGLTGSRLIVTARNLGGGQVLAPEARLRASASLGGFAGAGPVLRSMSLGAIEVGGVSRQELIPNFAASLRVARSPTGPVAVSFLGGDGRELAEGRIRWGEDAALLVPPGADRFAVSNTGHRRLAEVRAVFQLSL